MEQTNIFPNKEKFKPKLNNENLSGSDLKSYLILIFGDLRAAGQKAGFSDEVRVYQIISGYQIPKQPKIIKRISEAWNIESVTLTQLFEKLRNNTKQRLGGVKNE